MTWFFYLRRSFATERVPSLAHAVGVMYRRQRHPRRRRRHRRPGGLRGRPRPRRRRAAHAGLRGAAPALRPRAARRRCCAPSRDVEALRLRPDEWYEDDGVAVLAGDARRRRSTPTRARRRSTTATELRFDRAVLCTGSDALVPPFAGVGRCRASTSSATPPTARRSSRRRGRRRARAAVIGGGLLGLEAAYALARAGLPDDRRAPRRPADGAPARRRRRAALLAPAIEELGVEVRLEHATERVLGDDGRRPRRCASPTATTLDCDLVVVASASARTSASPATPGSTSSAASSSTTRSSPRTRACSRSASARSTAASSTASSRRSTTRRASPRRAARPARRPPTRARCRPRSSR